MSGSALRTIAKQVGIASDWVDAAGKKQHVTEASLQRILAALGFPAGTAAELKQTGERLRHHHERLPPLITATVGEPIRLTGLNAEAKAKGEVVFEDGGSEPIAIRRTRTGAVAAPQSRPGYHTLCVGNQEVKVAVAPPRALTVNDIAPGEKLWGLAVQLYSLRRRGDGGIGDTGALAKLAETAAAQGAAAVALSPVHALFSADPSRFGPYSPSSRLFLNPLLADPTALFGEARVAAASGSASTAEKLEHGELIDWPAAARQKYALLHRLFDDFTTHDEASGRTALARDFASFRHEGGALLEGHALFEALHRKWIDSDPSVWSWSEWPAEWRDPNSDTVRRFAASEAKAIAFQVFAQWIADRAFRTAQQRARDAGMRIGLMADLAIGMDRGGSHAWSRQHDLLLGLSVGAPPDLFNTVGQDWGLTGFSPQALRAGGYEAFLATLRAAMRHAGGVRIDHVMGLTRLWLIPQGAPSAEGAYLAYPIDDLLRLIALESHRHRAIVIGEDLGTVPPGFRDILARAGIAGMDVLWFQRDGEAFMPPDAWRSDAVAMTTTHDLPTVAGWWTGADIETRAAIGLSAGDDELGQRATDRKELWGAFIEAGVTSAAQPAPDQSDAAIDAALNFVAMAPDALMLVPIEDALGLKDQPNVPGTTDQHPNWRRRLPGTVDTLLDAPKVKARLAAVAGART